MWRHQVAQNRNFLVLLLSALNLNIHQQEKFANIWAGVGMEEWQELDCGWRGDWSIGEYFDFVCVKPRFGRVVRLNMATNGTLGICEIAIKGHKRFLSRWFINGEICTRVFYLGFEWRKKLQLAKNGNF